MTNLFFRTRDSIGVTVWYDMPDVPRAGDTVQLIASYAAGPQGYLVEHVHWRRAGDHSGHENGKLCADITVTPTATPVD